MQLDHASQEKIEQRYKPRRIPIAIKSADVIPERSNDQTIKNYSPAMKAHRGRDLV
jgi:hypothetical protein